MRKVIRELDSSAVSASIDMEDYFVFGDAHGPASRRRPAYHAAKVHNFSRTFGANEDYCERVGSVIKSCYSPLADLDISTLMDRVILREACVECVGGEGDEELCQNLAKIMISMGRTPFKSTRQKDQTPENIGTLLRRQQEKLQRLGRGAGLEPTASSESEACADFEKHDETGDGDNEEIEFSTLAAKDQISRRELNQWMRTRIKHDRRGAGLAAEARKAFEPARAQTNADESVRPLPLYHVDARSAAKSQADSVLRENFEDWLGTDEGTAWWRERRLKAETPEPSRLRSEPRAVSGPSSRSKPSAASGPASSSRPASPASKNTAKSQPRKKKQKNG